MKHVRQILAYLNSAVRFIQTLLLALPVPRKTKIN